MGTSQEINDLQKALGTDIVRPNLYKVTFTDGPVKIPDTKTILIHTANIPEAKISEVSIPVLGRTLKIGGDRDSWPNWDITVINDIDGEVRGMFEEWHNKILSYQNTVGGGASIATTLSGSAKVVMVNRVGGSSGKTYEFFGIFPDTVGGISAGYSNANQAGEYTVSFAVNGVKHPKSD